FFFQAEDGIRVFHVTGVQTCALPILQSDLTVLYRDEHLLGVAKPSGLLVHNGWAREADVALRRARKLVGRYVYPVHRLDRGTSEIGRASCRERGRIAEASGP